jgi:energy-coupling factor transport system ATP-binding protein
MLKFDKVSVSYPGRKILNSVSFELKAGEFAVLLGENGAGKSTLLRLCNGLLKPESGTVTVFGHDTLKTKTSKLAEHVGFLFQNPDRQICQKTVEDEIRFGLKLKGRGAYDIEDNDSVKPLKPLFGSDPFTLSRGERQRVALASVLVCEPELMLLDEPTVGLDHSESRELMDSVKRQQEKNGSAVLMITHDIDLADMYADRQLLLHEGQLIYEDVMVSGLQGD